MFLYFFRSLHVCVSSGELSRFVCCNCQCMGLYSGAFDNSEQFRTIYAAYHFFCLFTDDAGKPPPVVYIPDEVELEKYFAEHIAVGENFGHHVQSTVNVTGKGLDPSNPPKIA